MHSVQAPPSVPIDRRRRKTRAALLAAGERLFLTRGFTATTVEQLAQEADVAVGSLYGNFAGKDGLYLALIERALELDKRYCDEGWETGSDPISRMLGLAASYARFCLEQPGYFRLFRLPPPDAPSGGEAAAKIERLVQQRTREEINRMSLALAEASKAKVLREVDPERTAQILWAAWDGVLGLSVRANPPSGREMQRILADAQRLLVTGLLLNPG